MEKHKTPIGIFDSGFGGLTVYREIRGLLPEYDYLYLGDNARSPYGTRSFDIIYRYTLQGVKALLNAGCPLVILACNTASAKALRSIQRCDLKGEYAERRVLGVIRPSVEKLGKLSKTGKIGLFGTTGTVRSNSYELELQKLYPGAELFQEACPMWVPLVESNEIHTPAAAYFVRRHVDDLLSRDPGIDTIILACTHYPLLIPLIKEYLPESVQLVDQGPLVAGSLQDYLYRHPEIEERCSKTRDERFLTTAFAPDFGPVSGMLFNDPVHAEHIDLY
ncbi:MAG: glutamate racemase [Candidatus Marinimicrobia bacterium]|nr:glutamate racemase [Candidatus Neomarinimicrobiota bacterium]